MALGDLDTYVSRSGARDLSDIAWDAVGAHRLSPEVVRALRYMQDIEAYTVIYLRTLLSTRAVDDPEVATFLACWFYEETLHGRALARFLDATGHPVAARMVSVEPFGERLKTFGTAQVARFWPGFVAVHMVWGAINELTALTAYKRLAAVASHPVLAALLARIARDESRHFAFYYHQAEMRLAAPRTARIARHLVERFWAPVGWGVQPASETRFLGEFLFMGEEGRSAAATVDATIRRLPGFDDAPLLTAWLAREG